jgi:hypothetical protein
MPKLGVGLNLSVPRIGGAAPSGIPVASTASVTVAGFAGGNTQYNGTYTKGTSGGADPFITTPPTDGEFYIKAPNSFVLLPPSVTIGGYNSFDGDDYSYSFAPQGNWTISRINDDGGGATSLIVIASNSSPNNSSIPTTGWSPSITITAAIPVSTTTLSINGGAGYPTSIFTKATGNTDIYPCYYQTGSSDPTTKYTFNHLWRSSTFNGGSSWDNARLGVATRKYAFGSGHTFITGGNCNYETTVAVSPTWVLFYETSDEYGPFMTTYATNPSQDFNNVPTTGWVNHYDLPSVTITAA